MLILRQRAKDLCYAEYKETKGKGNENGMLRILRVDTLDDQMLDIELNNGHLILFSMRFLLEHNPAYAYLRGKIPLPCPVNQGVSIHWQGGPTLALEDILVLLVNHDEETGSVGT